MALAAEGGEEGLVGAAEEGALEDEGEAGGEEEDVDDGREKGVGVSLMIGRERGLCR